jgi:transcriptional regulator
VNSESFPRYARGMYNPSHFRESDRHRLFDLIDAHPFGTLVVADPIQGVEIAHVPFLVDRGVGPHGRLRFHVSRANPVARVPAGRPVVAVFHGPDAYVSASWYEKPREEVPTWNYVVVHAHGRVGAPMGKSDARRLLGDLAAVHETGVAPWRMDELDASLADELLDGITGLSIDVERLEGKFKLSQNRTPADRARVVAALSSRGGPDDVEMVGHMK